MNKAPVTIGERLVYMGNMQPYAMIRVEDVVWRESEARWVITVRWGELGEHGTSRFYGDDEGKTWYRYRETS